MHTHLAAQGLLPREHLLDTGDLDAEHLVTSRLTHAVELVGPVLPDTSWQARSPEGFDGVVCVPWIGRQRPSGVLKGIAVADGLPPGTHQHGGQELIAIQFDPTHGAVCPGRAPRYPGQDGSPDDEAPTPTATRGPPGRSTVPDDSSVPGRLCRSGWGGRDPVPGHARLSLASDTLYRTGEDPSATPPHGDGDASGARGCLVGGDPAGADASFRLCGLSRCVWMNARRPHDFASSIL